MSGTDGDPAARGRPAARSGAADAGVPDREVFEVEVSGTAEAVDGRVDDPPVQAVVTDRLGGRAERPPAPARGSRRRRLALVGGVATVVTALVAAAALADPGDDGEASPPTTAPVDLPPPPTLEPVPPTTTAPPPTFVRNEPLLPAIDAVDAPLPDVDLFSAIRTARLDRPLRTTTLVTIGERGFEQVVDLTSDPGTGRVGVVIAAGGNEQRGVIDPTRNEGYVLIAPGSWSSYPLVADDVDLWRRLVLGPLDADGLFRAAALDGIRTGPTVAFETREGETVATRAFAVATTAELMRGWVPYSLGPQGEAAALDDDAPIDLRVLVDAEDRIREIAWAIPFGNTRQVVAHRIDYPAESPVALPEIATS